MNMFDTSWLEALLQVVAPDEKYKKAVSQQPPESPPDLEDGWSMVAPIVKPLDGSPPQVHDAEEQPPPPKTPRPLGPPAQAFDMHDQVQCEHCQQMTPVKSPPQKPPAQPKDAYLFKTPGRSTVRFGNNVPDTTIPVSRAEQEAIDGAREAAKETAESILTSKAEKVMRFCLSAVELSTRSLEIFQKTVQADPDVAKARAKDLGEHVLGQTPLMVAAAMGNQPQAKIIMDADREAHRRRDMFGATALHHAAFNGQADIVDMLKTKHEESGQNIGELVDINGHTPLGKFMTSPKPKAKQNSERITRKLFSPEDCSIRGTPAPTIARATVDLSLKLAFGTSDMPGKRINMEDAICTAMWQNSSGEKYCLLGVCDGHGDQGKVSKYVSAQIASLARERTMSAPPTNWQEFWTTICLDVDKRLKKTGREGGSTAVLALITPSEIVVANVGDSRCILVQKGTTDEPPSLVEEPKDDSATETETANNDVGDSVVPLSEDHKPNLPDERRRIENANATVIAETFEDNGAEVTIHKVQLSKGNKIAVSRAFGDFEYKANKERGPDEQAVVAVPEIRVHRRDADRDMYLVLACDGVWDVMSNEEVGQFVVEGVKEMDQLVVRGGLLPTVGDSLLCECFTKGSSDNMSVVVAALSKTMDSFVGGGVKGKKLVFASPEPKAKNTPE